MQSIGLDTIEQASPWERLALGSGILAGGCHIAFLALFVALIAPAMPPMEAQAAAFYAEQSRNPAYLLLSYLFQAQLLLLVPFFGGLFGILRRAEGGSGALAASVFAAGVAVAVISPLAEMIEHHLLLGLAAAGADPLIVRGFDGMAPISFALCGFPQAVALGGTSAIILGRRLASRWLGWIGVALAALSLAATGALAAPELFLIGMLAALLFKIWIMALSVALLRGGVGGGPPPPPRTLPGGVVGVQGAAPRGYPAAPCTPTTQRKVTARVVEKANNIMAKVARPTAYGV